MFDVVANIKLSDLLREETRGDLVNAHIVNVQREPKPDFEAMRRVIQGGNDIGDDTNREVRPQSKA